MSTGILDATTISAYGMRAQGDRIRVISENVANISSTASKAGGDPYRRQTISFKDTFDRELNLKVVKTAKIGKDMDTEFEMKYIPGHPGANEAGFVKMPNVNMAFEMADMREAQRTYEANLGMLEMSRGLVSRLIDLLRA